MSFSRKALVVGAAMAAVLAAPSSAMALQPVDVYASSVLYENGFDHSASNVLNIFNEDAWAEGAAGTGVGESLTFLYEQGGYITQVVIGPGYLKSEDLFYQNCCPTRILLETGGASATIDLSAFAWNYDACLQGIVCTFDQPIWMDGAVALTVMETREGSRWDDCCITSVDFDVTAQLTDGMSGCYVNLNENDEFMLGWMPYWVYQHENWRSNMPVYMDLYMDGADLSTKAFVLYAYIYHSTNYDPRVSYYGDGLDRVAETDLYNIARELFGYDQCEAVVQQYLAEYSAGYGDGYVYAPGTGDFGSAGAVLFDSAPYMYLSNGQLVVEGTLSYHDSSAGGYVYGGTWEARYGITSPSQTVGTYYGVQIGSEGFPFKLDSLKVVPTGYTSSPSSEPAATTTSGSSGYTHATTSSSTYVTYPGDSPSAPAAPSGVDITTSLYQKAVNYCSVMYGAVPAYIDVAYEGDGTYSIHLYDMVDNHTATANWFYVDENGVGYDIIGSFIDLNV